MSSCKTISTILTLALAVTATLSAQQQDKETIRDIVAEGILLFQQQKVDEAISTLKRALDEDPNDPIAHNALGVIYSNKGDFESAMTHFDRAISLREPYFKAVYNKFNLLINTNRGEEAQSLLEDLVAKYPEHSDGWINLGVLYGQKGETDKALEHFDKAISINEGDYDAHFKKGQLLTLLKRYEDALPHFQRSAELAPGYTPATQGVKTVSDIIEKKRQGYIRIRQIYVQDAEVAQRIKVELDKGTDFAILASRFSADPSAKFGGDLGFVKRGELVESLENIVFALEIGQVSEIVRSPRGFHLFKREE